MFNHTYIPTFPLNIWAKLEKTVLKINLNHPKVTVILSGDFNANMEASLQDFVHVGVIAEEYLINDPPF